MKNIDRNDLEEKMPRPRRGGGGIKLAILALFALVFVAALAFWLAAGPEQQEQWRNSAADTVNDLASGTPLAGIGNSLRKSQPLPESITSPPTEKGTLAGRTVKGTIGSGPELDGARDEERQLSLSAANSGTDLVQPGPGEAFFSPEPLPPVTEDKTVKPAYLMDLADWLAARYRPGPNGGTLALSPQGLNHLGGSVLAGRVQGGRRALLHYAFQPSMIRGLYRLYIDQFMADLDTAASKRGLNGKENLDFHKAVAGKASVLAGALNGALHVPELGGQLGHIEELAQKSVDTNAQLANAVFELDRLRGEKASKTQIDAARMRVDGITARYRRAMDEHATAQRALAAEIRKTAGPTLDEEALLFIAAWVQRRVMDDPGARSALTASVNVLEDLARRCLAARPEDTGRQVNSAP